MAHLVLRLRVVLGLGSAANPGAQEDLPEHGQKPEGSSPRRRLGYGLIKHSPVLHPILQALQSRQLGLRSMMAGVRGKAQQCSSSYHPQHMPLVSARA